MATIRILESRTDPQFWPTLELYVESFPRDERVPLGRMAEFFGGDAKEGKQEGSVLWRVAVAEEGSELAGFRVFAVDLDSGLVFLVYLAVDPRFRRRGIGQLLIDYARDDSQRELGEKPLVAMFLECERPELVQGEEHEKRKERLRLFGKFGARIVSRTYVMQSMGEGRDPVPMILLAYPIAEQIDWEEAVKSFHRRFHSLPAGSSLEVECLKGLEPTPLIPY